MSLTASSVRATMPTSSGSIEPEVRQAFQAGLFALPGSRTTLQGAEASSLQSDWNVPVVLVSFSDDTLTYSSAGFDSLLFDTTGATPTGSVYDYYRWASGGRLRITGRVVGRVVLPKPRDYYGRFSYGLAYGSTPENEYGAVFDALYRCSDQVDWAPFDQDRDGYVDMLWVVHAGRAGENSQDRNDMWSTTSRMSIGWRSGGAYQTHQLLPGATGIYYKIDRFSMLPEFSGIRPGRRIEIGVFCHEFGHALGLPDLYDTSSLGSGANVGPGYWSLMSTGGYGGNGTTPEYPSHLGGWCSIMLGWKTAIRPARDTTIVLSPLSRDGPVFEFWYQGESNPEHFLLEAREREGFDRSLNLGGLIITHLDEAAIGQRIESNRINVGLTPGLLIVEADGDSDLMLGRNRGDAYDPFPGLNGVHDFTESTFPAARTFEGATPNIALRNIQKAGADVRFDMVVRAPGWLAPADLTPGSYDPLVSLSLGRTAVLDADGDVNQVKSEMLGGRSQIMLRSRVRGVWQAPVAITESPASAMDPCLARVGAHDLVVAWSDSRGGRNRIFYRARIQGTWTAESTVGDAPGDNRAPTIGVDENGRVQIAWLNTVLDRTSVWFERFLYFLPRGQAIRVTGDLEFPGAPVLAVSRTGTSHLIWMERGASPQRLYFSRFHPDSGLSARLPLTAGPTSSQGPFTAFADSAGTLHAVWSMSGSTNRELHYLRRPVLGPSAPRDTVIEERSAFIEQPSLTADPAGTIHLSYVSAPLGTPQVYYKRWRPVLGWDAISTEISTASEGSASEPMVLSSLPGTVSVLYTLYPGTEAHLIERRRQIESPVVLASLPPTIGATPAFTMGPNPLVAGQALELRWTAGAGIEPVVDLFDLGGRRVASVPSRTLGTSQVARLEGDRTRQLSSGVYFARPRGWSGAGRRLVVLQ